MWRGPITTREGSNRPCELDVDTSTYCMPLGVIVSNWPRKGCHIKIDAAVAREPRCTPLLFTRGMRSVSFSSFPMSMCTVTGCTHTPFSGLIIVQALPFFLVATLAVARLNYLPSWIEILGYARNCCSLLNLQSERTSVKNFRMKRNNNEKLTQSLSKPSTSGNPDTSSSG